MTRMERRRRRRRILQIKLATTAAVLALTTASIVALTGGGQPKRHPNQRHSRPCCRLSRFCWLQSTTVHISQSR